MSNAVEWKRGFECSACNRVYIGGNSCPIICGTCGSRKPGSSGKWSFHVVDVKVKSGWFRRTVLGTRHTGVQVSRG